MMIATWTISQGEIRTGISGEKLCPPISVAAKVIKAEVIRDGNAMKVFFVDATVPINRMPADTNRRVSKVPLNGLCPEM